MTDHAELRKLAEAALSKNRSEGYAALWNSFSARQLIALLDEVERARAEGYAAAREQAATNIEDAGGSMAEYYAGLIRAMEMSDE